MISESAVWAASTFGHDLGFDGGEGLKDFGVEDGVSSCCDERKSGFGFDGAAVGARGADGIEGVGKGDDACFDGDFVAGNAGGVATAVPSFVMVADDQSCGLDQGGAFASDQAKSGGCVTSNGFDFAVSQRCGFVQDGCGDG